MKKKIKIPKSKYFKLQEFNCNDGTPVPEEYYANVQELMDNLDVIREHFGYPINVNSGYRTPDYNKAIGGAKNSQHLTASAADIRLNVTPSVVQKAIKQLMEDGKIKKGGLGIYSNFTHYDIGRERTW
tara:strand:- start:2013 stop:2396 length:384 start_codon:yes stop_codon:yes gene_type:complete